jgi:hypothetical protein
MLDARAASFTLGSVPADAGLNVALIDPPGRAEI